MLNILNELKHWQAAIVFVFVGFLTFFSGLNGAFQNDDFYQIVNNTPVHSLSNIPSFFQSSTFYNGEKLTGVYYRPLMTTTFSAIYTFFGENPFAYHFVQLSIYIASAFILFLVFRRFIKPVIALLLSLVLLVHPLNSQIVYSIPTMQDVLFFFFGILAIWMLINKKDLWKVVLLLLLAMFSKESGILFVLIAFAYLYLFDKNRIVALLKLITVPIILYVLLRMNAVGISGAHHAAPINDLGFIERMFTAPSVLLFYIGKFLWPDKLSLGYYWTYPSFSLENVLLPLIIDVIVVGIFIYLGALIKRMLSTDTFKMFLFFSVWTILGLGLYMQVIPGLDFTACETWFYFAMAGVLGTIGVSIGLLKRINYAWLVLPLIIVILTLGVRSNLRGYDYESQYRLATVDISVSDTNFAAINNLAQHSLDQGDYNQALELAKRSIDIYPIVSNYINYGVSLQQLGRYDEAIKAYEDALVYGNINIIYENLALIHIVNLKPTETQIFFQEAFVEYPRDFRLWLYYAVFQGALGNKAGAVDAITNATKYGQVPQEIYDGIMSAKSFTVPILGKNVLVKF